MAFLLLYLFTIFAGIAVAFLVIGFYVLAPYTDEEKLRDIVNG